MLKLSTNDNFTLRLSGIKKIQPRINGGLKKFLRQPVSISKNIILSIVALLLNPFSFIVASIKEKCIIAVLNPPIDHLNQYAFVLQHLSEFSFVTEKGSIINMSKDKAF